MLPFDFCYDEKAPHGDPQLAGVLLIESPLGMRCGFATQFVADLYDGIRHNSLETGALFCRSAGLKP